MDFVWALVFGLVATGLMSGALWLVRQGGAEGVWGIGSTVPRPPGGSDAPGMLVHIAAGLLFGVAYLLAARLLVLPAWWELLLLGVGLGVVHSLVKSGLLAIISMAPDVAERWRAAGPGVAVVHLLAHVLHGVVVSLLFGVSGVVWYLAYS